MKTKKVISTILALIILLGTITCFPSVASAKSYSVKATRITSLTQTDITTFKINWAKVSGVKGYVLYYSTNGSKYKKLTTTKSRVYYHKNLKNGVKYYYKMKTYTKVKGKTKYSKFSNIRTAKCNNYLLTLYKPYRSYYTTLYKGINSFEMTGDEYTNGFVWNIPNWGYTYYCDFNLKGKYSFVEFTYGYTEGDDYDDEGRLRILSDDDVVATYSMHGGDLAKRVKVNIKHANKLEFLYDKANSGSDVGIGNIKIYK